MYCTYIRSIRHTYAHVLHLKCCCVLNHKLVDKIVFEVTSTKIVLIYNMTPIINLSSYFPDILITKFHEVSFHRCTFFPALNCECWIVVLKKDLGLILFLTKFIFLIFQIFSFNVLFFQFYFFDHFFFSVFL